MKRLVGPRAIALFAGRFLLGASVLLPVWWLAMPYYGWALVQGCGVVLRDGLGMNITAGTIETAGIMNTKSQLVLYVNNDPARMEFVKLATNLPPFIALLLATPGLSPLRRIGGIAVGSAVLCLGHALFVIVAFRYAAQLGAAPAIPTALTQLFLTLPFLLWVVVAFMLGRHAGQDGAKSGGV